MDAHNVGTQATGQILLPATSAASSTKLSAAKAPGFEKKEKILFSISQKRVFIEISVDRIGTNTLK